MRALRQERLFVSHDVAEACSIADYVYLISGGRVVAHGTPAELQSSGSDWVGQFMHGLPDGPVPFHYPARDYAAELLDAAARGLLAAVTGSNVTLVATTAEVVRQKDRLQNHHHAAPKRVM